MKMIWGSPPHVRGKDYIIPHSPPRCGITPACAGKSVSAEICRTGNKDHPRTCGEKHTTGTFFAIGIGITPAHAGKRHSISGHCKSHEDHPRTCGEK